ncbi:hypothetical protein SAMN04515620_11962 [Collimonas sp. OK607]|nr:hypothetical protein SAMN04515620_11962 [Collimonas sp. OK607]
MEYSLVANYVICFDDMERKGGSLSVREIMGLTDELARRKNCKVVLIFNDNSFSEEKDKQEFESYREKVVDAELDHNPTHKQNLECVFSSNHRLFATIETVIVALDLKNIRVIKKLKGVIDTFWSELENSSDLIVSEFINHAAVLCWSYYLRGTAVSFDFLKVRLEDSYWSSYFGEKDKEVSSDEKRYRSIASTLRLSPSIFDKYIIHYLVRGYVDVSEAKTAIQELSKKIDVNRAQKALSDVWSLYSESFADNQVEIVRTFKSVLSKEADKLNLSEYASALEMLSELGEDVDELMENYVTLHETQFVNMDRHDTSVARRVSYKPLIDRIKTIQAPRNDQDIDQVCMKIATTQGWNPEDIDFLCSVTQDEFVAWIKTNPTDLSTKLRSGLLFFGDLQSSDPDATKKHKLIYGNVRAAIRKIASESSINQKRAKVMYGIDVDS